MRNEQRMSGNDKRTFTHTRREHPKVMAELDKNYIPHILTILGEKQKVTNCGNDDLRSGVRQIMLPMKIAEICERCICIKFCFDEVEKHCSETITMMQSL